MPQPENLMSWTSEQWRDYFHKNAARVVWWKHRHALRAGGYSYRSFKRAARREMSAAVALMNPRNYGTGPVADARLAVAAPAAIAG